MGREAKEKSAGAGPTRLAGRESTRAEASGSAWHFRRAAQARAGRCQRCGTTLPVERALSPCAAAGLAGFGAGKFAPPEAHTGKLARRLLKL